MVDPLKVLLVEDHPDTRTAMAKLLRRAGFHVVEAATVADGISKVDGQAVALLDLNLPDGLGTEVFQHIQEQKHRTHVAFLTAAYDPHLFAKLKVKADAVFRKPTDFPALLDWIEKQT